VAVTDGPGVAGPEAARPAALGCAGWPGAGGANANGRQMRQIAVVAMMSA